MSPSFQRSKDQNQKFSILIYVYFILHNKKNLAKRKLSDILR